MTTRDRKDAAMAAEIQDLPELSVAPDVAAKVTGGIIINGKQRQRDPGSQLLPNDSDLGGL